MLLEVKVVVVVVVRCTLAMCGEITGERRSHFMRMKEKYTGLIDERRKDRREAL